MKETERLNRIRKFLLERQTEEGVSEKGRATWTKVQEGTKISIRNLSSDLKLLMEKGEVKAEQDTHDRRKTWYWLNDKKGADVKAEVRRYLVKQFLDSMVEPSSFEAHKRQGSLEITFSVFAEAKGKKAVWPEDDFRRTFPAFQSFGEVFMKEKGLDRFAIFVGWEKKESVKP